METNVLIPKDSFILEYLGEIITTETLMKRMETIYKNERHYYVMTYSKDLPVRVLYCDESRTHNHTGCLPPLEYPNDTTT